MADADTTPEITEKDLELLTKQVAAVRPRPEMQGVSGTDAMGFFNPKETNADLFGQGWVSTSDDMLLDANVWAAWSAIKNTLQTAKYRWVAGDKDDPLSLKLRDYAQTCWNRMAIPWEKQLDYLLNYLVVGFRYAEMSYETIDDLVWLRAFVDREPSAHEEFIRDEYTGVLVEVSQNTGLGTKVPKNIDASKLLLLTNDMTGQNYAGRSAIRSMYYPFKIKNHALNQLGIGIERWATPVIDIFVDREAAKVSGYKEDQIDDAVKNAKLEAQNLCSMRQGYVVSSPGVKFGVMDGTAPAAQGISMVLDTIQEMDNQMMTSVLVQFLRLGVSDSGSRGVSETLETFFRRAAVNVLDNVVGTINGEPRPGGGVMERLINWNFGSVPRSLMPKLVHDGLQTSPLGSLLSQVPALLDSKALSLDPGVEAKIREALGMDPKEIDDE